MTNEISKSVITPDFSSVKTPCDASVVNMKTSTKYNIHNQKISMLFIRLALPSL